MNIAGIEPCSFVDWPGRMAAVLFTPGCNLDCYYCHNRYLLDPPTGMQSVDDEAVLDWLDARRGFLDGVVVSGGEPTLQTDLADFIERVRERGFAVKLDTNGTRPSVLNDLFGAGLLDYVAMDIKAPENAYAQVCGVEVDQRAVGESIRLIMARAPDYEFRTTVVPQLCEHDILEIVERIRGAKRYVLQQYRMPAGEDASRDLRLVRPPHTFKSIQDMARKAGAWVSCCETRGLARPEPVAAFG